MIDKRINFRFGGDTMGGRNDRSTSSPGADDRSSAQQTSNNNTQTGGGDGGGNQFTGLTKDVLNPNVDFVGDTIFGATQKYSGDGLFSGYRNLNSQGQPLSGLAYVGDRLQNLISPSNIMGGILGLVNPLAGLAFRGFNYMQDKFPETLDQFKSSDTLEEFRDKFRGYGKTMPVVSPNPMYGGIESLGVQPIAQTEMIAPIKKPVVNEPITFDEMVPSSSYIPPYTP